MNDCKHRFLLKTFSIVIITFLSFSALRASTTRTQVINLHKGWNAVFLQVTPTNSDPSAVFNNSPVSQVAIYFDVHTPVQFIQNPGGISWKKDGWAVWYAPNRPDAFLSSLYSLDGNKAYLIFSEQDFVLSVIGNVYLNNPRWQAESFNLVGFSVNSQSPPTFDKYFAGSSSHSPSRIYRLVNDQWALIANTSTTTVRAGEAYWVYCKGASDYQGPLSVSLAIGQTINFNGSGQADISFKNATTDPMNIAVDTINDDGGVPLSYVVRGIAGGTITSATFDLPVHYAPPALEGGQSSSLWLTLHREKMTQSTQSALLKISSDSGVEIWLPVTGNANP